MNALSSELDQTAINNSYNALSEAYDEGLVSPAVLIANSTFESWIEHQLLQEDDIVSRYGGSESPEDAYWEDCLEASSTALDTHSSRVEYANENNLIDREEYQILEGFRQVRNQIANEQEWYASEPLNEEGILNDSGVETGLDDGIRLWERLMGVSENSILAQGRGEWEQEYLSQTEGNLVENMAAVAEQTYSTDEPALNPVAGIIAYNSLLDQVPERVEQETELSFNSYLLQPGMQDENERPIPEMSEVLPSSPRETPYDFLSSLENMRMLFAHNVESFSLMPNSRADEIIDYGIDLTRQL